MSNGITPFAGSGSIFPLDKTLSLAMIDKVWSEKFDFNGDGDVTKFAVGGGICVGVVLNSDNIQFIASSDDGASWQTSNLIFATAPLSYDESFDQLAYGQGTFIAVYDDASVVKSADGINWTDTGKDIPIGGTSVETLHYDAENDVFIACDNTQGVFTSTNGEDFTAASDVSALDDDIDEQLVSGGGVIVGFGGNDTVFTSEDGGETWTKQSNLTGSVFGAAYFKGSFFVFKGTEIFKSTDGGANWSSIFSVGSGGHANGLFGTDNAIVCIADDDIICVSYDGSSFKQHNIDHYLDSGPVTCVNGIWICSVGPTADNKVLRVGL